MRARKLLAAALVVGAGLLATGCGTDAGASGSDRVSLMLDVAVLPKHAPFYAAAAAGFFEEEGIDLEIMPGSGSANTVASVDTGRVDFGWADFNVSILNRAQGANIQQINLVQGMSAYAALALPDSGIADWDDLKGKTVATEGNGAMVAMWPAVLDKLGWDEDDVAVVSAAGEAKIPGLIAKQWDANLALYVSDAPMLVAEGYDPVVLKWADLGLLYYGNGVITSGDTIANDPDLVERFTRALQRGFVWSCQNQEDTAASFSEAVPGFDDAALAEAISGQCDLMWSDESREAGFGTMSDAGVQKQIDVAAEYLGLENPGEQDPADMYTNEFLEPLGPDEQIPAPNK
ncbi:ABC transporter substrate-binding protein [Leucobacter luti]|uniref:NitT/TauT family transport system substrate-binding protein n=1 Tax=Leucobacter luti TaxID=340320 RepID=A0A4Q7TPY2_9MICO|nr:ABC transporter substrate-binding protein [Leucobacter luti]MBL3699850.1 nitrate ABC transporter substrate-binding protein [Leucobacter luti]RZT62831.1 NitT/TauT family transport system substrate-binding protein [Leucobacter luti]